MLLHAIHQFSMKFFRPLFVLALLHVSIASAADTREQKSLTPHYAFSNYFGSGLYSSSGQELTVFNLPFDYEPEQESRYKYRYRLPISIGFYDYNFDDVENIELPNDVASITLTAGIEFDHWVNDDLKLVPFLDIGISENLKTDERAVIYASGITSFYYFDGWNEKHVWLSRLQRAGYRTDSPVISDGFSSLETGLDLILPWRFNLAGTSMFVSAYAMQYWYFIDLVFNPDTINPTYDTNAQEVGVTFGFDTPMDMWLFDLERIGLGYRRSNGLNIYRLIFNFPLE